MSEAIQDTQNDFWRPPLAVQPAQIIIPAVSQLLVEACSRCETEFMVGARFCYVCGSVRRARTGLALTQGWTRYLEFTYINQALALPVASLIAFIAGLGSLLAAALVGALYPVQNFGDFQAIQFWRMQWLLAAIAFFVAGILLKRSSAQTKSSPL
jgi:hypothetical protein